jgi:hypothetical protein
MIIPLQVGRLGKYRLAGDGRADFLSRPRLSTSERLWFEEVRTCRLFLKRWILSGLAARHAEIFQVGKFCFFHSKTRRPHEETILLGRPSYGSIDSPGNLFSLLDPHGFRSTPCASAALIGKEKRQRRQGPNPRNQPGDRRGLAST